MKPRAAMNPDPITDRPTATTARPRLRGLRKWLHWVGRSALAPERFQ